MGRTTGKVLCRVLCVALLASILPVPAWAADGVADNDEVDKGGLVVRNYDGNNAPRKKITLSATPAGFQGNVILSRNNTKVKVYDAATGGDEITFEDDDNKFAGGTLPKFLYVQGNTASTNMRDVTLELSVEGTEDAEDTVKFTVLWVSTPSIKCSDSLEGDNTANLKMQVHTWPSTNELGRATICGYDGSATWLGASSAIEIGYQTTCTVAPSDFVPGDFSTNEHVLHIVRKKNNGAYYYNQTAYGVTTAPVDDTSNPYWRDDDPQSGGSAGKIYDTDGPGIENLFSLLGTVTQRARLNFGSWAEYDSIRCSEVREHYHRHSFQSTNAYADATVTSATATTLQDNTKNWTTDVWETGGVLITDGPGEGQVRQVVSNTANTLTVQGPWTVTPTDASSYRVISMEDTWILNENLNGDNENGDGTTLTTWDFDE